MTELTETEDEASAGGKRARTPGIRYPGSSLRRVFAALSVLHAAGGTATIGTLAARIKLSERNADFVRLVASARSYGLADWANPNKSALRLTDEGAIALSEDGPESLTARQRAALRPDVFRHVARLFEGRGLPSEPDLNETFIVSGVAPSAAPLASRNFVDSLDFAELLELAGDRRLLRGDLPFAGLDEAAEVAGTRAAARPPTRTAAVPVRALASSGVGGRSFTPAPPVSLGPDAGVVINVKLDVSGWDVEKVVELVARLKETK
jgi:hypothetical protein